MQGIQNAGTPRHRDREMAGIQQQQLVNDTLPASWNGSSNRIASVDVEGHPQPWVDDLELKDPNQQVSFIYICSGKLTC